jgi:hypothetical protein
MEMRKIFSVLLICMMVFGLIGCSKDAKEEETNNNEVVVEEDTDAAEATPVVEETPEVEATPVVEETEEVVEAEPEVVVVEKNANEVIEIEAYDLAGDVVLEDCSDENGGKSLGGVNNEDYVAFLQVNFGAGGFSKIAFRAASWYEEGGDVELHLGAIDGELVGTYHIPGTGDWSIWETITCDAPELAAVNGIQDVYMVFKNGGDWLFNLNWFQFGKGPKDAAAVIEAEDFVEAFDVVVEGNADTEGAQGIGGINNADYSSYNINFGDGGYKKLSFRASSGYVEGGDVEIRLGSIDGELVGTGHIDGSGDWGIWETASFEVEGLAALTGEQLVYFVYTNGGDWLFNLNWFQFEK